jgi:hypothetical protein
MYVFISAFMSNSAHAHALFLGFQRYLRLECGCYSSRTPHFFRSTGCGLPAGPFGLYGALEGLSYLWVVGLVGFSIYTKATTGKASLGGHDVVSSVEMWSEPNAVVFSSD